LFLLLCHPTVDDVRFEFGIPRGTSTFDQFIKFPTRWLIRSPTQREGTTDDNDN